MTTVEERRTTAKNNYELQLANRLTELTVAASSLGPTSTSRHDLGEEHETAKGNLETVAGHINHREPNILVHNQVLFWTASLSIFVIEAVINKVIVDMAAQTAGGMSLLVAALISVALVSLAHWSGHLWRQIWSDSQRRILIGNVLLGVLLLIVVSAAVLAIMALRAYFALVNTAAVVDVFSDAIETLQELGFDFVLRAFAVPESMTIGGLNILALLVAFLFGFFSHDSDHQFDVALRKEAKALSLVKRHAAKYEAELRKVFRSFRYRIERAQAAFVANKGDLSELPVDDFKAQRAQAEGMATLVKDETPAAPRPAPTNVTVLSAKPASGNPW